MCKQEDESFRKCTIILGMGMAAIISIFICILIMTSCTLSFNMVDNDGPATDVIDDNDKTESSLSIPFELPV